MDAKHVAMLRNAINLFVKLSDKDWELLVPHLSYRHLDKGGFWITEGKREQQIGFILNGNMRHYYTHDGEEKTTYFYFENHLVGSYFSALTGQPSRLTIEALTDCSLITFPYSVLLSLYDKSQLWERFGRVLAEYLVLGLEERMTSLLIHSPEERYLQLLHGNKMKIIERIPQHLIANYLGITPVSLSRIRARIISKKER
ncbi:MULTISPECIES: Crp/Fnr family transcriptional regulator [unclassified Pedobacter]|uniref:Crp/Fnr family transcriptional regulator n=1 Tax=unclassified Pedobacter TaxID=2628915 RepID=UPI001E366099|nr:MULTISPECIES: Crp/Fnr family transcriptional regulator [unclassified Pedobacter]